MSYQTKNRIPGFDLARTWVLFGMLIVNFNYVFGDLGDPTLLGQFNALFSGNSSAAFVILAGMGVSLLTFRPDLDAVDRLRLRQIVVKRSWFLFALGLFLYPIWPGDILHFYGGYMHLAAMLLFVSDAVLLSALVGVQVIFYLFFMLIPYENGWNWETYSYTDFWTISGFLRNTFYNGWNPIFPWASYFLLGMWLGRRDWTLAAFRKKVLFWSVFVYFLYVIAEYTPPFLPFMIGCASSAVATIVICFWLGARFSEKKWLKMLVSAGQLTLTNYILHCTIGMILLKTIGQKTGFPCAPMVILGFSAAWFFCAIIASFLWKKRFKNGPMELLMRKITG
jgi:uncharacterized protein